MNSVVERDPQLSPAAGPVGLQATEVKIAERPAWKMDGFLGILIALVLAGLGMWSYLQLEEGEFGVPGVLGTIAWFLSSMVFLR